MQYKNSTPLAPSELIINPDGSIYHLNLRPEEIGDFIITVGDPHRVERVSRHFDQIELRREKREFVTHTGRVGNQRVSVISTGIGPDNIDIVFNELDALVNIDFKTRMINTEKQVLRFIRIGTTGSLQPDLPVDSVVCSSSVFGFDNLLHFYEWQSNRYETELANTWEDYQKAQQLALPITPYAVQGSPTLLATIGQGYAPGITITAPGFYAPQGRQLRARSRIDQTVFNKLRGFRFGTQKITNLEMETSAIYALSRLLGHEALSCSAVLANRANNTFSEDPKGAVDRLIETVIGRIRSL